MQVLLGDGKGGFTPLPPIYSVDLPGAVVTADFNGDGKIDVAVQSLPLNVEVLLGNGDGTFQNPTSYATGDHKLIVGDFNGDQILDLATSSFNAGVTTLLIGNGDGTFRAGATVFLFDEIVAADFNLDGNLDLADPHQVAFGNGDGTFQTPVQYGNSSNNVVATGDFNGDGIPDLAVAYYLSTFIILHLGNGDGTFQTRTVPVTLFPNPMTSGDFNGDGISDIFISDFSNVEVLLGHSNGAFGVPTSSFVPSIAAVTFGHFNEDGNLDVVTASPGLFTPRNQVYTLIGNGAGGFDTPRAYLTDTALLQNIVTGDFNKDGIPDVAVSSGEDDGVEVLLGAKGGFKPPILYSALNDPGGLAVGDVNNDGNLDLLTAEYFSNQYSLLLGNGDGTFQPPLNSQMQFAANELLLADFNNDGNLDLASSGFLSLGNGDGTFQPYFCVSNDAAGFAAGDLNGDGNLDFVFSGRRNFEVFLGNGDGTFTLVQKLPQISQATWITVADLNADGKLDLIAPNSKGVMVALGLGNGNFSNPAQYATILSPFQAQVADFDQDGKADIAVITGSGQTDQYSMWIRPGNGDGTFQPPLPFALAATGSDVFAIADFNGDGKPDIASLASSQLLVLKNTSH